MARPRTVSDEDVLAAARKVFLARGPGAPVSDIAARVGLSQPALFRRFGDKNEILRRALEPQVIEPREILGPAGEAERLGTGPHLAMLAARLLTPLQSALEGAHVLSQGDVGPSAEQAHERRGAEAFTLALIQHLAGLPGLAAPPEQVAETLLLLVHGAALMRMADAHGDADGMLARGVELLADELKVRDR